MPSMQASSVSDPAPVNAPKNASTDAYGSASPAAYCEREELANTLSHGIGVLAALLGTAAMLYDSIGHLSLLQTLGVGLYGLSMVLLFACSTAYHWAKSPALKRKLKLFDHCAIYLLIAGTYTPFVLITLEGAGVDWVLAAIWLLALGGIGFKLLFLHRFKAFSLVLYLAMGWLCVAVLDKMIAGMTDTGFTLLLTGGLFYSLGVVFYAVKRIPFNHAIWHLFVLGGAISHFLCIYLTVIPKGQ
ncbi:PAQR family membrane homeostasis protein TrhA [Shewanella zhangzhouensis]|uniref:PAQR family membrane homeostasis protein TrhA n=1 Tax=Shewanella zhangzhouensis TaxID=2864213 RepID=UPI001C662253|nr:hemolysin III family protein [Shewanella zhangzhouensis]QYK03527.1 hemolysin III family protein [Shewanella zhangzhouensis]